MSRYAYALLTSVATFTRSRNRRPVMVNGSVRLDQPFTTVHRMEIGFWWMPERHAAPFAAWANRMDGARRGFARADGARGE
jgi:hypothetical protein